MPATPHDALFKSTFSRLEHAEQLLRDLLPKALVDRIDFSTLRLCPGSFVDEELVDRHTDLLFSVEIAGRPARIYVLCEHSSYVDPLLAFRLLAYMVRIWEGLLKDDPSAKKLPAIVPLVIHHSEGGFTGQTAFEGLLDVDAEVFSVVADYVPGFRFLLDDISAVSDESIRSRAMSAVSRLVLFCLKHARASETLVERLRLFVDLISELRGTRGGRAALRVVWMYIFQVSQRRQSGEVLAQLKAIVGQENAEELMNVAEMLEEKGRERGRAEGRAEGRVEGRVEGRAEGRMEGRAEGRMEGHAKGRVEKQQTILLKLLRARFGAPPEDVAARVMAAAEAELDRWTDRALTALTLADVFGDERDTAEIE